MNSTLGTEAATSGFRVKYTLATTLANELVEVKASVAIASNESFSGWTKTFSDPRLCAAIVDRLTFGGTIIETGTDSYRCSDSVREGCLLVTQPRRKVLTDGRAAPNLEEGSPWPSCSM